MATVAGAWIKISPDLDGFREELLAGIRQAVAGIKATVNVYANTDPAKAQVASLMGELAAAAKKGVTVKVGADSKEFDATAAAVEAEVAALDGSEATVQVGESGAAETLAELLAIREAMQGLYRMSSPGTNWAFGIPVARDKFGDPIALMAAQVATAHEMNDVYSGIAKLGYNMPNDPMQSIFSGMPMATQETAVATKALTAQAAAAGIDAEAIARLRDQLLALGFANVAIRSNAKGALSASVWDTAAAAKSGSGGGNSNLLMSLLWGRGGAGPGGGGGGFGRFGLGALGGLAGMGSIASFAGLGPEHVLMTLLGLAGSATGGLLGGGLLAAGAAGTAAVGMGTDLAGIGQAAGDIKTVYSAMGALNTALATYGKGSLEAATAQSQLDQALKGFNPVARGAVEAAAKTAEGFKAMFDKYTGGAEKLGAEIINQGIKVGEKFLPTIGKFATSNTKEIQKALQPLFSWIGSDKAGGGLAIFTQLETKFSKDLPTAMQAFDNAVKLVIETIGHLSPMTGGFMKSLDDFFTKYASGKGLDEWYGKIDKLVADFRLWDAFVKELIRDIADLFEHDAGTAKSIVQYLTSLLDKLHAYEKSAEGGTALHSVFTAHKAQILELLKLLPLLVSDFGHLYLALAPTMTRAFAGILTVVVDIVAELNKDPLASWILGVGLISGKLFGFKALILDLAKGLGSLFPALKAIPGIGSAFSGGNIVANTTALAANTEAVLANTASKGVPGLGAGGGVAGGEAAGSDAGDAALGLKLPSAAAVIGTLATAAFAGAVGYEIGKLIFPKPNTSGELPGTIPGWAQSQNWTGPTSSKGLPAGIGSQVLAQWGNANPQLDQAFLAQQRSQNAANELAIQGEKIAATSQKDSAEVLKAAADAAKLAANGQLAAANKLIAGTEALIIAAGLLKNDVSGLFATANSNLSATLGGIRQALTVSGRTGAPTVFRAGGGSLLPGQTAVVGEKGPELLQMGSQGANVIPNHQIRFLASGTGSGNYTYGVSPTGVVQFIPGTSSSGISGSGTSSAYQYTGLNQKQSALDQQASSLLSNLQSTAQSVLSPLQALSQQLNATQQKAMAQLVTQLRATHQVALEALATQIVQANKAAQAALNEQLEVQQLQALAQQTTDAAQAYSTLVSDTSQLLADVASAHATQITDKSSASSIIAANAAKLVADKSKLWVDQYNAQFQFGIAKQAAEEQVALDKLTTRYDAAIGADQLRAARIQQREDSLVAVAQKHLDEVAKRTAGPVAAAQAALDKYQESGGTNAVILAKLQGDIAKSEATQTRETAAAQARLTAAQAQAQTLTAQANAAVNSVQGVATLAEQRMQAIIDKENAQAPGAAGIQVNVQVESNADPNQIAQEVGWEMRLAGVR